MKVNNNACTNRIKPYENFLIWKTDESVFEAMNLEKKKRKSYDYEAPENIMQITPRSHSLVPTSLLTHTHIWICKNNSNLRKPHQGENNKHVIHGSKGWICDWII